jgi:hypothetical protein
MAFLFAVSKIKVRPKSEEAKGAHPFNAKRVTVAMMIEMRKLQSSQLIDD